MWPRASSTHRHVTEVSVGTSKTSHRTPGMGPSKNLGFKEPQVPGLGQGHVRATPSPARLTGPQSRQCSFADGNAAPSTKPDTSASFSTREALGCIIFHKNLISSLSSLPIYSKSLLGKLAFKSKHFVLNNQGRNCTMHRSAGRGKLLQGKTFMRFPFHEASSSNSSWLHHPLPHRGPFPNLKTDLCNLRRNAEI